MSTTFIEQRTCDRHGQYAANHLFASHWTGCPTCQAERDEREQQRREEVERQELISRRRNLLFESGIVGRFEAATFESFKAETTAQRRVLACCRDFADRFDREQGGGLWLIGPPGVGKSHLGAAVARAVIEQHVKGARIASARQIVRRLRDTWRHGAESEADVISDLGGLSLLIVDEVGGGFASEAEQVQLFDIVDARYVLRRPTIVLSNLNEPLIRTAVGDRAFDRLREGARILIMNWPSYRRAGTT